MKRMSMILGVCMLSLIAQAELVTNSDFDSGLSGWSTSSWGSYYAYTDSGDSIVSWGWWGGMSIWQNTGYTFEADTVYTLSVTVRKGEASDSEGVIFSLIDVTNSWTTIITASDLISLTTYGSGSEWETFTLTLDTADYTALVGHTIGVGVQANFCDSDGMGWLQVNSVSLVPEPASMLLLGLGGVLLRRNRH